MRRTEGVQRLPLSIIVSNFTTNDREWPEGGISLRIEDRSSRTMLIEARLTFAEWGKIVGRHGYTEFDADTSFQYAGMEYQHDSIEVPGLGYRNWEEQEARANKVLVEQGRENWTVSLDKSYNQHRVTKDGYLLNIYRFVPEEGVK